MGDYFVTEINKQLYVFKIDGSQIKIYRQTLVRSFRILIYDTSHYLPVNTENNKELELILKNNSLPKMNRMLFNVLKLLGRREKAQFTPHLLQDLVTELSKHENEYSEQVKNITNYLDHLHIDQIVTPVRRVTDFIEDDIIAPDPGFLGTIVSHYQRTDIEHKKVTNTPSGAKIAWAKWIAIFAIIGLIVMIAYVAYSNGWFNNITNPFGQFEVPSFGGATPSANDIMSRYTPEELRAAIDRGEVDYNSLPSNVKSLVDNVKLPSVQPSN